MEILTRDTQTDKTEMEPDETTGVEVTPIRGRERSIHLKGMKGNRRGLSSSHEAKSPAGTDQTLALLLPHTETDLHGTRSRRFPGISPVITGQSQATWHGMAALSLPGTRGLSLDPTYAPQTCQ